MKSLIITIMLLIISFLLGYISSDPELKKISSRVKVAECCYSSPVIVLDDSLYFLFDEDSVNFERLEVTE